MKIVLQLLFVGFIAYTSIVNLISAGQCQTAPTDGYWRQTVVRADEFDKRFGPVQKVHYGVLSAGDLNSYYSSLCEAARVSDAYGLMGTAAERALSENPSTYNEMYVADSLKQANVAIFGCRLDDAQKIYQTIYEYDLHKLGPADERVGRDLNNLGMVAYLKGAVQTNPGERSHLFDLSTDYYSRAATALKSASPTDRLAVAENQSVLFLDAGNPTQALASHREAEGIRKQLPINVPVLDLYF